MATEKKVYDYAPDRVRDQLLDVFRKRKGEATAADLVAQTGLPTVQVETEIKAVSDEYGARLRVTESGDLLYSFPDGLRSRYRGFVPGFLRGWKAFKKGAARVGAALFKVWIVVMLVGYFVLFVALALLAMLASVAVSMSGNSRDSRSDRGGGLGGFGGMMIFDAIIRIWFYSELFKDPYQRQYERGVRADRRKNRRPLYKAIFSFVFGDGDPDAGWDAVEKKAVVAFVQAHKGVITLPEFMSVTGLPPAEAETRINRYLYEFEGSPEVTEGGAIYYSFPSLMRRKDRADRSFGGSAPMRPIAAFSANPKKSNIWFGVINAVNFLFGGYFAGEAASHHSLLATIYSGQYASHLVMTHGGDAFYLFVHQLLGKLAGIADPKALIGYALGAVPLAFSVFFYAIPAIRSRLLAARNERARVENLRRVAYRVVLDSPAAVRVGAIAPAEDAARPKNPRAAERIVTELAAWAGADPKADGSYEFGELARTQSEAAALRSTIDTSKFDIGGTVFDSRS
ncbi:MAG: hypothetical protein ACLQMF_09390 [Rectinemataceae bacterium]